MCYMLLSYKFCFHDFIVLLGHSTDVPCVGKFGESSLMK